MTTRLLDLASGDVHADAGGTAKPKAKKRRRTIRVRADIAHGGTLHVRHMKNIIHGDPVVLLASSSGTDEAPVWIQIAKAGSFAGHSAGPFEMNARTFDEIIRNFKAHPEQIPVDFEHASESDASSGSIPHMGAPAQGWIVDMRVQDGNLWGLVEWGTLAREYIKNGQYKYFSPAIRFGAKDRVSGKAIGARMTSGALTNSPFLSGMQAVAAKDVDDEDPNDPASADEHEDAEMEIEKKLKETEGALAVMTDKHALADEKAKAVEKVVTAKDAEITTLKAENTGLLAWKTEREEKDQAAEVEVAYETYKDQRKLTDAMRGPMLAMLKAAPTAFREMYPAIKSSERHLLRNLTEARDGNIPKTHLDGASAGTQDHQLADETFSQTVSRLMSEKKISYLAASRQAEKLRG